jgi:hypothetical protein
MALLIAFLVAIAMFLTWRYTKKRKGGGTAKSTPTPSTTPATVSATLPRDWKTWVKIGLLVVAWVFIIWFFPDTVPGKALLKATGFSAQNEWYPWVMQYLPTALLVWIGWWILSAGPTTPVAVGTTAPGAAKSGGFLMSIIGWALFAIGIWFLVNTLQTWNDSRSTGPTEAKFIFNQGPEKQQEHVDREGRMELWYPSPGYHCGRIVGPAIILEHPKRPQGENFIAKSAPGGWWYFTFTPELKKFLKDHDVREPIKVEFEVSRTPIACV